MSVSRALRVFPRAYGMQEVCSYLSHGRNRWYVVFEVFDGTSNFGGKCAVLPVTLAKSFSPCCEKRIKAHRE